MIVLDMDHVTALKCPEHPRAKPLSGYELVEMLRSSQTRK
jgi:hypothetical protein